MNLFAYCYYAPSAQDTGCSFWANSVFACNYNLLGIRGSIGGHATVNQPDTFDSQIGLDTAWFYNWTGTEILARKFNRSKHACNCFDLRYRLTG